MLRNPLLAALAGTKYATSPRPPDRPSNSPPRLQGRASVSHISVPRASPSGRLRFVAFGLFTLIAVTFLLSSGELSHLTGIRRHVRSRHHYSTDNVDITMLDPYRLVDRDPGIARVTKDNELFTVAGVVQDQRSTWQEGSRPPYFVRFTMYYQTADHENQAMDMLIRINATYTSHPSKPVVRCRPFSISSNSWPLRENFHYDQPPHTVECDIPEEMATEETGPPRALSMRVDLHALQWDDNPTSEALLAAFNAQGAEFEWPKGLAGKPVSHMAHLSSIAVPRTEYTLCLVPFRNYEKYIGHNRPHRFIEWRLYWLKLGVTRVVWYAYEGEPGYVAFVEELIKHLGTFDEIHVVKRMPQAFPYWDQPLYYNHCGEIYRQASNYIIILDLDEVIMLEPSQYTDPAAGLADFVASWAPEVGGVNMIRFDLSMPEETFWKVANAGGPTVDLLAQDTWTALKPTEELRNNYLRKSMFRAKAGFRHWTHYNTWLYPQPEPLDQPLPKHEEPSWPKPWHDWRVQWQQQEWPMNTSAPDYWTTFPRMVHFRWWGGVPGEIGSELWPTHPALVAFKDEIRKEVLRLGEVMDANLKKGRAA